MEFIEIVIMLVAILIVALVLGRYIYRRIKKKPTGECCYCHNDMKRALKKISKDLNKEREQGCNC